MKTVTQILDEFTLEDDAPMQDAKAKLKEFIAKIEKIHGVGEAYPEDKNHYCVCCVSRDGPCATIRNLRKYLVLALVLVGLAFAPAPTPRPIAKTDIVGEWAYNWITDVPGFITLYPNGKVKDDFRGVIWTGNWAFSPDPPIISVHVHYGEEQSSYFQVQFKRSNDSITGEPYKFRKRKR